MPRRKKSAGTLDPHREISAQVILRPAGGRRPQGSAPATAETIQEFLPAPDLVRQARSAIQALGFRVGPFVGNSFAITAPAEVFGRALGVNLRVNADGGIECVGKDGSGSYECPREQLPREVAQFVDAITFTPPPAFGPTRFAT